MVSHLVADWPLGCCPTIGWLRNKPGPFPWHRKGPKRTGTLRSRRGPCSVWARDTGNASGSGQRPDRPRRRGTRPSRLATTDTLPDSGHTPRQKTSTASKPEGEYHNDAESVPSFRRKRAIRATTKKKIKNKKKEAPQHGKTLHPIKKNDVLKRKGIVNKIHRKSTKA